MAETTYTYTKSGVIPHILQAEIVADTNITIPIAYVLVNRPDDLRVIFSNALSAGEKTELDSLISLHPQAIPEEEGSTDIPTGGYPAGYVAISNGASGTIWLDLNAGIVDHATLSGLSDDDHNQYLRTDGTRQLSGNWDFGADSISGTGLLAVGGINRTNYVDVSTDLGVNPSRKHGRIFWDNNNNCVGVYDENYGTTLQVGQENYVRAVNNGDYEISDGRVVYINGSSDGTPSIGLSIASDNDEQDLGVTTSVLTASGGTGFVTTFGMVNNLNLTGFADGDVVYTSATISGGITKTRPQAPNRVTPIGVVVTAGNPGRLYVSVKKSTAMTDITDAVVDSAVNNDVLVFNSVTSLWEPQQENAHDHTASQISYTSPYWPEAANQYEFNDVIAYHTMSMGGSGRLVDPVCIAQTGAMQMTVYSGTGHIIKNDIHYAVSWPTTVYSTYLYANGAWYIYVDETGTIHVTQTEADKLNTIPLGGFYTSYYGTIGTWYPAGYNMDNSISRIASAWFNLGPFVISGGTVTVFSGSTQKIVSSQCTVQNVLETLVLNEVDSDDGLASFFVYFRDNSNNWYRDTYVTVHEGNKLPTTRYNIPASGVQTLPYACSWVQYASAVTSSGDLTSYVKAGDYFRPVTANPTQDYVHMMLVASGAVWNGSTSTIQLAAAYYGATHSGTSIVLPNIAPIPADKWIKPVIVRTLDNMMHMIHATEYYDTKNEAEDAALPLLPAAVEQRCIKVAALVFEAGTTDLNNCIVDIRPLPFNKMSGGGAGGGGGGVTVHGDLSGLANDDHPQYLNITRGDARYYTQTQLNAGQLDNRYYTETEVDTISGALNTKINTKVNASDFTELAQDVVGTSLSGINITITYNDTTGFTTLSGGAGGGVTAHSSLTGLSADDHTQYTLANGTRAFTSTVSGVTPTLSPHLTTKGYVDTVSGAIVAQLHTRSHAMTGTSDHTAGNYKVFYSTAAGQVAELALSTSGTVLTAQGASAAPVFAVPSAVTGVSGIQGGGTLDNNRTLGLDINGLTRDTVPNVDDYVATYETSTGTHKKVTLSDTSLVVASGSYFYEESDGESGTSSTTYQDKTILSASGIISGTYRLLYTCEYQAGANNKDVSVRVFDTTVSGVYAENSQQTNSNLNWFTLSGFKKLTLSAGTRDIRWQYKAGTTNIIIRRARLELRRVS